MQILTKVDTIALELAASAWADLIDARKILDEKGMTETTTLKNGRTVIRTRPEVQIARDASRRLEKTFKDFGLSPATRAKLSITKPVEKEDDSFEDF